MDDELRTAWLRWLANEPARCVKCGAVKQGDDLTYNLRTGKHICDDCIKAPAKK